MEADGIALPVIEARCKYVQAARYDDELEVATRGALLSPARVAFDYEVVRSTDRTVTALGRTVHAAVNGRGRPCRLPDRVRTILA